MTVQEFYIDFKSLRQAYNLVKAFVEKESFEKVTSLKTKLAYDLGLSGDDNLELLEKFVAIYKLDTTGFVYAEHFESEDELFDSSAAFLNLLAFSIFICVWVIKIFSINTVDWTKKQLFPNWHRQTLDLTFGDMLTWYLMKEYNLRKDIRFILKSAS